MFEVLQQSGDGLIDHLAIVRELRIDAAAIIPRGMDYVHEAHAALDHAPRTQTVAREVVELLKKKWAKENDYRLKKTLWAFTGNRIAVRFEYEWHDDAGQWWRSHGNENWEFDEHGYMAKRYASINDQPIREEERKLRWERK